MSTARCSSATYGGGAYNTAQRRVITHTGNRIIGHNLIDKLFLDVPSGEKIKPTDPKGYPLPFAKTRKLMLSQAGALGVGACADTQASAGQGVVTGATSNIAETVGTPVAIAAEPTTTTEMDDSLRIMNTP